jgi:hypothetical protein
MRGLRLAVAHAQIVADLAPALEDQVEPAAAAKPEVTESKMAGIHLPILER